VAGKTATAQVPEVVERVLGQGTFSVEKFVESFPALVEAAGGVALLRHLVLDLAIRGSLSRSETKSGEETAEKLLARANAVRVSLVEGRESGSDCDEEIEVPPFSIPPSWVWTRIGRFAVVRGGKRLPAGGSFSDAPTRWIYVQVTNMKRGTIDDANLKYIDDQTREAISRYTITKDDLYITIAGTIGDVGEVPEKFDGMNLTENAAKLVFRVLDKRFVLIALRSGFLQEQFVDRTNQMAQPKLALKRIAAAVVPLPPLAEQKRIVARVDQLMALIDQLEAKQNRKHDLGARFTRASLEALTTAESPQSLSTAWTRLQSTWPTVLAGPDQIPDLRAAILELAICGALTGFQSRNAARTWPAETLGALATKITDGDHLTPRRSPSGRYLLSARNVRDGYLALDDVDHVPKDEFERMRRRCDPNAGDLLISCSGSIGRVAIVDRDDEYVMVRSAAMVRPDSSRVTSGYLLHALRAPSVQRQMAEKSKASAQANLFIGRIKELQLPVPPLEMQAGIVAKVEHLMKLCDALESALRRREDRAAKLGEAVVQEMVA
jgi:type I restriction enzyme S subunit